MSTLSQQLILKEGNIFLVSHDTGDITGNTGQGMYYHDIRHLSYFTFEVNGQTPDILSFSGYRNFMGTLQLTNGVFQLEDGSLVRPETLSIRRSRFITNGLHERLGFANYNRFRVPITVTLAFGADFRDLFDLRGFPRKEWGKLLPPIWVDGKLALGYEGLDGLLRRTEITFDLAPDDIEIRKPSISQPVIESTELLPAIGAPSYSITIEPPTAFLTWHFTLEQGTPYSLAFHVRPVADDGPETPHGGQRERADERPPETVVDHHRQSPAFLTPPDPSDGSQKLFDKAVNYMRMSYLNWEQECTDITTDNEEFNQVLWRSKYDLRVLCDEGEDGYFPSAGIPWYVCPFGRDSLITSLQTLALNPKVAVGTLHTLARYQGTKVDPWREEQPGKILHELRMGEMVRLNLVPHSPYYGSIDATPLFIMLFVETMRWLDDQALYDSLLPNVMRALEWINSYGDIDGDGFVEYVAATHQGGIRNQVWKDSSDSIQMPNATLAETPIAAVEVQAYVYAAKKGLADLLLRKGDASTARRLTREAEALKKRFNQVFWMPKVGFYCQGLDKEKRQVPTISSNPGHALWTGIADPEKAQLTVQRMMELDMLSGWGVRTISRDSASYNPMSYHNGSVWPHDNSILAAGFKRYGCADEANTLMTQIEEAAQHFRYSRLPELYCGFGKDTMYGSGPAEYPVSCSPQAWAAGAPILMMQAMLGLEVDAASSRVLLKPKLPSWITRVQLRNLRVGTDRASIDVSRFEGRNEVSLESARGDMRLELG